MTTSSTVQSSQSWRDWLSHPVARTATWAVADVVEPLTARPLTAHGAWRWPDADVHRSREERRRRRLSVAASAAAHAALLLVWLWWSWMHVPAPPASSDAPRGDGVLQVEYIGIGTPEQTGGGEPDAAAASAVQDDRPPAPPSAPAQVAAPSSRAATAATEPVPADPAEQPIPAPQPLVITQVERADSDFVLPPTRTVTLDTRPTTVPPTPVQAQVQVKPREVVLEDTPAPPTIVPRPLAPPTPAPIADAIVTPPPAVVRQRDVVLEDTPAPAAVRMPSVQTRPIPAVAATTPAPSVRTRDVPMAPSKATSAAATPAASTPASGPPQTPAAAAGKGRQQSAAPGAGAKTQATAGGQPSTTPGDDWGVATRNRPGGGGTQAQGAGLYGDDGRPNLTPGAAASGGGMPPGTDDWTRAQIDGNGTWLKRPPLDYRASAFEQYWRPHENLLEEWVRRGVKQMHIPIPGTSKRITCVVSMLQLGGGCGITDPNVNDQEAVARPPPDIPYKPELQDPPATPSPPR